MSERCDAVGSSAWLFGALGRWLPSNVAASDHIVLPATGRMHQSQLLLSGENMILEEGGRKVAVNEGDFYNAHPLIAADHLTGT